MKKQAADKVLFASAVALVVMMVGCGSNNATEAVNESVETEEEGKGGGEELTPTPEEEKEEEAEAEEESEPSAVVGLFFPSDTAEQGNSVEEEELIEQLQEAGYDTQVYYADGDAEQQVNQISQAAEGELQAMVISPVDEYALAKVLEEIDEKDIPVFSYDKLIRNTDAVNYYVTFDERQAGQQIAENIIKTEDLEKAREDGETKTIEFLMGSPDDVDALFLYNGIMEVLQEYLDDGTLVCKSGMTSFDDTAVIRWSELTAKARLADILEEYYQEESAPDIICAASDAFAHQTIQVLEGLSLSEEEWPEVTGVGAAAESVKEVASGKQAFTLFKDERELAKACAQLVDTYLQGEKPDVNDYEQYDNGVKIIGTYACEAQLIDQDNYQILIDNGYYQKVEIAPNPTATPVPTPTPEPTVTPTEAITPTEAATPTEAVTPEETETPSEEEASDSTDTSEKSTTSEKAAQSSRE